jgi:molybdopterin-guanine dinucleotide biosynthesis protein A
MAGIFILSQPIHTGKTTRLQNWLSAGCRVGGFLTPDVNQKRMLYQISNACYHPLQIEMGESGIEIGKFNFSLDGFATAQKILEQDVASDYFDWVVVDEVGRLEMDRKQGLEPTLSRIIKLYEKQPNRLPKLLLVIRDYLLADAILDYQLQNATVLPPEFFDQPIMSHSTKTIGLIMCGGKSTRMKTDKAFITYHQKPQYQHVADMLKMHCDDVAISCNPSQASKFDSPHKLMIDSDTFANKGPMTGVLSAIETYPNCNLFVCGCDYPYLTPSDLEKIVALHTTSSDVTCFAHPETGFTEPLIGIYSHAALNLLKHLSSNGLSSLRHFAESTKLTRITPTSAKSVTSIDTPI